MKRLLIRADDLGYSEAVNYGIEKSVRDGLIRSVGMMPNMDAAEHGFELVKDCDIALGQHSSVCVGKPVCDPELIPSLVGADGEFRPSSDFRNATEDFVDFEEAKLEIRAQLERFREITGREPDYFEGHAVASPNLLRAIEAVRVEEGLRSSYLTFDEPMCFEGTPVRACAMDSMSPGYDATASLKREVEAAPEGSISVYVCHPGYLDDYILNHSSLTVNRTKEVATLCDPEMRTWLEAQPGLELIDYRDL